MNLFKKNYLAVVRNAAKGENHMFQNYFIELDGKEIDALDGGGLSCASFVSAILYLQNPPLAGAGVPQWLSSTHANVSSNEKDMAEHGWSEIDERREGAVITWEKKPAPDGTLHLHQGFYVGNDRAVSNGSNTTHMPEEHHATYDGTRKIIRVWWHEALNE